MQESEEDTGQEGDPSIRIVLMDTNSFLRLYHSPVRPFLGAVIGAHRLMTMTSLVGEFMNSPRLQDLYAWVIPSLNQDVEVEGALLELSGEEKALADENYAIHKEYARQLIDEHCARRGIKSRTLSRCDLELLAVSITLQATIATDEWPLKLLVDDLVMDPEAGYQISVITSLDVLKMLEDAGKISPGQRRETVKSWIQYQEMLPRDWKETYARLFEEKAPTL